MPDAASDLDALSAVATDYVEGMIFVDAARMRRAFHPRASVIGHWQGELVWDDLDAFIAEVGSMAEPPLAGTRPDWRIVSVAVAGDTAVMQVEDVFLGTRFIDTLSLVKDGGRWQIVTKIFWADPGKG